MIHHIKYICLEHPAHVYRPSILRLDATKATASAIGNQHYSTSTTQTASIYYVLYRTITASHCLPLPTAALPSHPAPIPSHPLPPILTPPPHLPTSHCVAAGMCAGWVPCTSPPSESRRHVHIHIHIHPGPPSLPRPPRSGMVWRVDDVDVDVDVVGAFLYCGVNVPGTVL